MPFVVDVFLMGFGYKPGTMSCAEADAVGDVDVDTDGRAAVVVVVVFTAGLAEGRDDPD